MATALPDRTVLGFRVSFLWGVAVGVGLALAVLLWAGVARRVLSDPCERPPPVRTYTAESAGAWG